MRTQRVGIFAGSFDPVHQGHVNFANWAIDEAKLDKVYFLPEGQPRHKTGITHQAHRLAMLKIATKPYSKLKVLDLPDRQFSVAKTLPRLKQKFNDDQLFLIIGSDVLDQVGEWPLVDQLLAKLGLIIGLRSSYSQSRAKDLIQQLQAENENFVFKSPSATMSSAKIRQAIGKNQKISGMDPLVLEYIKANWLYSAV